MLERARQALIKRGLPQDQSRVKTVGSWITQDGDIPEIQTAKSPDLLSQSLAEYKNKSHTSEFITSHWQTLWKVWGERVNLSLDIPPCDRTEEEVKQLEEEGRKLIYVPQQLSVQKDRHLLGQIFPKMSSYSVEENNPIGNETNAFGWLDIETSIDSPNVNSTEEELKQLFKSQKREGLDLNEYIIGSQHAKLTKGRYFDEGLTLSRLLSSRDEGRVVHAYFFSDGRLRVRWDLSRLDRYPRIGGRSRGVKKA